MAMSNIPTTPQKTFPFVNIFPHDLFRMQGSQIFVHSLSCMFAFCISGGSHSQDTRDQTFSDLWGLPQKAVVFLVCFFWGGLMAASWKRQSDRPKNKHKGRLYLCGVERGLEVWHWSAVTTIRGVEETGIGQWWHSGTDQWSVPQGVRNTVVCPVVLAKWLLSGQSEWSL